MVSDTSSPISPALLVESDGATMKREKTSTSDSWELIQEQWQKEQQRRRMVRWRVQKKEKMADMNREWLQLEKKLRLRLNQVRVKADTSLNSALTFQQLTVETVALRSENITLQEELAKYSTFDGVLERETREMEKEAEVSPPLTSLLSSRDALAVHQDKLGWRVFFPNEEPSFHFHPFSREEFDAALKRNDQWLSGHSCIATVGKLFGWTVDYAPLARNAEGSVIAHAKFSRRLHCSLNQVQKVLPKTNKNTWPVIIAPRSYGRTQNGKISYQALQSFDEFAHVLVCNIPGDIHLRYIAVAQHTREILENGKRAHSYSIFLTESKASKSNQDIHEAQNVQLVTNGGTFCTFTEVDENTTDVEYHHWAGCLNESLGRELYIDWIRFPVLMEQYVSSARFLTL